MSALDDLCQQALTALSETTSLDVDTLERLLKRQGIRPEAGLPQQRPPARGSTWASCAAPREPCKRWRSRPLGRGNARREAAETVNNDRKVKV
ncbi:MAG TPA: hypothetical protein VEJ23_07155 [Solirubrobacteraceae bacterium]|nr:hypothetical protein [Solirubrobacteraceae bacterium]